MNLGDSCSSLTDYLDYQHENERIVNGSYEKLHRLFSPEGSYNFADRKCVAKEKGLIKETVDDIAIGCPSHVSPEKLCKVDDDDHSGHAQFCKKCGYIKQQ